MSKFPALGTWQSALRCARECAVLFAVCLPLLTPSMAAKAGGALKAVATPSSPSLAPSVAQQRKLSAVRLPFVANQGQLDPRVKFFAKTFGGTTFVTSDGKLVHSFAGARSEAVRTPKPGMRQTQFGEAQSTPGWSLVEELVNAKRTGRIEGEEASGARISSFIGNDRSKWQTDVPTFGMVNVGEIYPHISYRLRAYGNNVEKLFQVRPGGKPQDIQVKLKGARALKVTQDGALEASTNLGPIRFTPPIAYQEREGRRVQVAVAYEVKGNRYGFKLGAYDESAELVIDPLLQSTYLGGSGRDEAYAMALDSVGNVYVAGLTYSVDFPGVSGGLQVGKNGGSNNLADIFVAKLNASLTSIVQATYLGGSDNDVATSLRLDAAGNVYMAGWSASTDFPGTTGGAQVTLGGSQNAFVVKLNGTLTSIVQATYLGGSGTDDALALALDVAGNVYVAGYTSSVNFPGTAGGAQAVYGGGTSNAFVAKLNGGLTSPIQATYLGGSGGDFGYALALDTTGNVYVTGSASSVDFPGTAGGAQEVSGGGHDAFVIKLNGTLTSVMQATYLGGSGDEYASGLVLDASGNVYMAGITASTNFPRTAGGVQPTYGGGIYDAFVAKLDGGLTHLIRATYLGGSDADRVDAMALDAAGNIVVAGSTASTNFPRTAGGAQAATGGGGGGPFAPSPYADGFVSKFCSLAPVRGDLNGDCKSDIFWLHATSTQTYAWLMNGIGIASSGSSASTGDVNWQVAGIGDFDGDGKADLLWRNTASGTMLVWLMNGTSIVGTGSPATVGDASAGWAVQGIGDFDGDGKADILWQNTISGTVFVWKMNGTAIASTGSPATVTAGDWTVEGVGDFDGDGKTDILWRNTVSGTMYVWLMNGTVIASTGSPATVGGASAGWAVRGVGDIDGDGKADIVWQNTLSGSVFVWLMNGTAIAGTGSPATVPAGWTVEGVGDYDGDGKADLLWRNTDGTVLVWLMNGTAISTTGSPATVSDINWQVQNPK